MNGLWLALAGAALGSLVTWLLGSGDRKLAKEGLAAQQAASKAQTKLAEVEAERSNADNFARFSPRIRILGAPAQQSIRLESPESFNVEYLEYLNGIGAKVGSEAINRSGTVVEIPINAQFLMEVNNIGPWTDHSRMSAEIAFRFNIHKSGYSKHVTHTGQIRQEFKHSATGGMNVVVRVIG
jgi:hypothetical protein